MGSGEHADDMLKYFTLGFEDSLAKVKELQPSFSTGSILPPNKVIEFRARLKGSSSQSKKNPSTGGVPKSSVDFSFLAACILCFPLNLLVVCTLPLNLLVVCVLPLNE